MNHIDSTWLSNSHFKWNVSNTEPLIALRWNGDWLFAFSDPLLNQQHRSLPSCFGQIIWRHSWLFLLHYGPYPAYQQIHILTPLKYTYWYTLSTRSSILTWLMPSDSQDLHCLDSVTGSSGSFYPLQPISSKCILLSVPWVLTIMVFPLSVIFIFHIRDYPTVSILQPQSARCLFHKSFPGAQSKKQHVNVGNTRIRYFTCIFFYTSFQTIYS